MYYAYDEMFMHQLTECLKRNIPFYIMGPCGSGKTYAVYEAAKRLGYDVLEMNSGDARNKSSIESLSSLQGQQTLFMRPQILLFDDVDVLSGRHDRGGLKAIVDFAKKSSSPVILTLTEYDRSKHKVLKDLKKIECRRPTIDESVVLLSKLGYTGDGVRTLARMNNCDIRAMVNDAKTLPLLDTHYVSTLSSRDVTSIIEQDVTVLFNTKQVPVLRTLFKDVDMDFCVDWVEASVVRNGARALPWVATADLYRKRIRKKQYWRYMAYVYDFVRVGVGLNTDLLKKVYQPMVGLMVWQGNMKRAKRKSIAQKLAPVLHQSVSRIEQQVESIKPFIGDDVSRQVEWSETDITYLRG